MTSSEQPRTYWLEHAWLGTHVEPGVALDVRDGRITAVNQGVATPPPGAGILRGLTLPGLANAHSHAFHRALRGTVQVGSGTFWTWREVMYSVADRLTPDTYHALARAVYAEMALAGITAVGEFHYVHHAPGGTPYADPNAMGEALIEAAAEAGVRITLLDTCYLSSGFGEPPNTHQRRFSDGTADAWAERCSVLKERDHARIGAAIHSVRAVPADQLATVASRGRRGMAKYWWTPFLLNVLLGIPGVVPFWLVWYLMVNWPLAELGWTVREPTENDGMVLWLVIVVPVVAVFTMIWWLVNAPLRRRTSLTPHTFWLLCGLAPLLPTAALIANSP